MSNVFACFLLVQEPGKLHCQFNYFKGHYNSFNDLNYLDSLLQCVLPITVVFHCFSSQEVTPKEQKNSGTEYTGVLITCHIPQYSACDNVHSQHACVLHMLYVDLDLTPVLKRTTIIWDVEIVQCAKIVGYSISIVSTKCVLCTMLVGKPYVL